MKKYQTVFLFALITATFAPKAQAQNLQFHYDLGHTLQPEYLSERPSVTTTFELFKPDAWGSTFLFIDLDYYSNGMGGAYWEIAREFNITKNKQFAAHVEYDGGLSNSKHLQNNTRFQQAALAGLAWNWHSADFQRTFSIQALYKQYFKGEQPWQKAFAGFQLTEVWGLNFANGLCTFSGFCDLWFDKNVNGKLILLSEPQFWFNLKNLAPFKEKSSYPSIGTEVEISNNFIFPAKGQNNRLFVIPTLAFKWNF